MIYLGRFVAGASIFYGANFHNDTGALEDPTNPAARIRTPDGAWSDLSTPTKQDSQTGFYGGSIDTTGFSAGQYIVRLSGTVSSDKNMATVFCFEVGPVQAELTEAYDAAKSAASQSSVNSIATQIGTAGSGLTSIGDSRLANLDAAVSSRAPAATALSNATWTDSRAAKLDNLDATVSSRSTLTAQQVWEYTTRSLTTFGTLASDVAAAVWGATTRTLTGFGSLVADMADAVWGAASRTLTSFGFAVTAQTVQDKTGYSLTEAYDAAKSAAQPADIPTTSQIADKILGRNLAGGADGGRTVRDALRGLRNRREISAGELRVYQEDDSTVAWTAAVTTASDADPVTGIDPE